MSPESVTYEVAILEKETKSDIYGLPDVLKVPVKKGGLLNFFITGYSYLYVLNIFP